MWRPGGSWSDSVIIHKILGFVKYLIPHLSFIAYIYSTLISRYPLY